jgi:hypothetical protein
MDSAADCKLFRLSGLDSSAIERGQLIYARFWLLPSTTIRRVTAADHKVHIFALRPDVIDPMNRALSNFEKTLPSGARLEKPEGDGDRLNGVRHRD